MQEIKLTPDNILKMNLTGGECHRDYTLQNELYKHKYEKYKKKCEILKNNNGYIHGGKRSTVGIITNLFIRK